MTKIEQAYRAGETKVQFESGKRLGLPIAGLVAVCPCRLPDEFVGLTITTANIITFLTIFSLSALLLLFLLLLILLVLLPFLLALLLLSYTLLVLLLVDLFLSFSYYSY